MSPQKPNHYQRASGKITFRANIFVTIIIWIILIIIGRVTFELINTWDWVTGTFITIITWFIAAFIKEQYLTPFVGSFVDTYFPDHDLSEIVRQYDEKYNKKSK